MTAPVGQAGQTLVIFALVLVFFLVGMLALVADLGTLFVAYNRVDDGALLATQAGASAIDQGSFYGGSLRLDPQAAEQRCQDSRTGCSDRSRGVEVGTQEVAVAIQSLSVAER